MFNRERYAKDPEVQKLGGLTEMVEHVIDSSSSDEEEAGPMDTGGDEEEERIVNIAREQFIFPVPDPFIEYSANGRDVRFNSDLPLTELPEFLPHVFKALSSVAQLTAGQKRTMCGHDAMPMPVHSSPIIALFKCRIPKGAVMPWSSRNVNWMLSTFHLREFLLAVEHKTLPLHSSVDEDFITQCSSEFRAQVGLYERFQEDRIGKLFDIIRDDQSMSRPCLGEFFFACREAVPLERKKKLTVAPLDTFIKYMEEYSLYYIHSIERFLYKILVEPYKTGLELQHVLTPNLTPTLHECNDMLVTR